MKNQVQIVWICLAGLLFNGLGVSDAKAGGISGFLRVEGTSLSPVTTNIAQTIPGLVFFGDASVLSTDPGVFVFSVFDITPPPPDFPDILLLNMNNLTGQTINQIDLQLGQIDAGGDFELIATGGPTFLGVPTVGGQILSPSHLRMENLAWTPGGANKLVVNPLLVVSDTGSFHNGELAVQFDATAAPEPASMVVIAFGSLAMLRRSRRIVKPSRNGFGRR